MPIDNNTRINQKLKHFQVALVTKKSNYDSYLLWVMKKLGNFNNQITSTDYLEKCKPVLIGSTALYLACIENDLKVFYMLLAAGTDYTLKNQNGLTIIHLILESISISLPNLSNKFGNRFIAGILTAHIKNNKTANPCNSNGLSHFHAACMINYTEAVEFFLNNNVSVNDNVNFKSTYYPGYSPLHFAVKYFSYDVMKILLRSGANVFAKDKEGITPLQILNSLMRNRTGVSQSLPHEVRCLSEKMERLLLANIVNKLDPEACFLCTASTSLPTEKIIVNVEEVDNCKLLETSNDLTLFYKALKNKDPDMTILKIFVMEFKGNESLQEKVKIDSGLTMLHIACRVKEPSFVENLLKEEVDVNVKINADSSIWPGCTPLNVCMNSFNHMDPRDDCHVNEILKMLLNRGADVTLRNNKLRTPIHTAYQHYIAQLYYCGVREPTFERLNMLLKAQKDFSVNSVSIEGITHFHIACSLGDSITAESFLKCRKVNIDQPLDFFFNDRKFKSFPGAGCTPLHLAVMRKAKDFVKFSSQLETIDLLLKYGADVNAENAWGETPFHIAVHSEIRDRLVSGGANVNAKNAKGYSPLEELVSNRLQSGEEIINLLGYGCYYNAFNCGTEYGLIGLTVWSLSVEKMQELISTVNNKFPNAIKKDEYGRTLIHNLFSVYQLNFSPAHYAILIEQLANAGFDIDDQDNEGRTALHMAVKFKNLRTISTLLLAGADINITDVNGQTAFAYQFQPCSRCNRPTNAEDEQCEHYKIFKYLSLQVLKLELCGLDVHPGNEKIIATDFPNFRRVNLNDQFIRQLGEMEITEIESLSLSLRSFLCELNVVNDYATMSDVKKKAIDDFFSPGEKYNKFCEKYSEIAGLLKLQYRKAVKRIELLQNAQVSLDFLAGDRIPELVSRIILRFLKNSELQAMISATEGIKNFIA